MASSIPVPSENAPRIENAGRLFPATAWTLIRGAQDDDPEACSRAMERLISVYWRPVHRSIQRDWRVSLEEARDLTQEYFSLFLEKHWVREAARDRGRFRAFVKTSLRNFMLNRRRAQGALKRGAGRTALALEALPRDEPEPAASREPRPDVRFERELMRAMIARSMDDLARSCEREGRLPHFELFREYYTEAAQGRPLTYDDLRGRFGLGPHEVKNRLAELRTRFRKIVLGYLRDGISSERELISEIREVFDS